MLLFQMILVCFNFFENVIYYLLFISYTYLNCTDEMYAAIIDPSSESETYAQIPSANNIPVTSTGQVYKASTSHINGIEHAQSHSREGNNLYCLFNF